MKVIEHIEHIELNSETDSDTENDETCIPEPLSGLFDPSSLNMNDNELFQHGNDLYKQFCETYSQKSYENLRKLTEKQALSNAWLTHRAGRITASVCHQVAHMRDSKSLIRQIMQYNPPFQSKYTEYGKDMEPRARTTFLMDQSQLHNDLHVKETGLTINADFPCLGATPDGIVTCSCHGKAVLEIKCPFTYKDGFDGWENDNNFPIGDNWLMKKDHKYYFQVQMQIRLCQADFGYFYVFSPAKNEGLLSIVGKNDEFMDNLVPILLEKFHKFLLPEIVSRKMDSEVINTRRLFCHCNRPEFGNMICCDNGACEVEWFYYSCVNITRAPKGKWYCFDCRKKLVKNEENL